LKSLSPAVTEVDDYIVLTYTVNNKTVEAFIKAAIDEAAKIAKLDDATKGMLTTYAEQAVEMMKAATIDLKAEFYLNPDDNTFAKQVIAGKVTADGETVKVDMTTTYSETEIKAVETIDMGEKMTSGVTVTRATADDGSVTYKFVATGTMNEGNVTAEMTVCELEATYKADGNVSVKATIPAEVTGSESDMSYELVGKLDLSNGAKFTFTEVKSGSVSIVEGVTVTISFNPGAEAPSAGTVKDVVDLTEEDLTALQEKFENGVLGALMGGAVAGE